MANEITLEIGFTYEDTEDASVSLDTPSGGISVNVSSKRYIKAKQQVGIVEEAIILGEVTAPGYAVFYNRDETNFINLLTSSGGVIFGKLLPGKICCLYLGLGAQVPFAIADTAACQLEYLIVSQ